MPITTLQQTVCVPAPTSADVEIYFDAYLGAWGDTLLAIGEFAFIWRGIDTSNFYYMMMPGSNIIELGVVSAGTPTVLSTYTLSTSEELRGKFVISSIGNTHTISNNGIVILSATDSTITQAGNCGVASPNPSDFISNWWVDNYVVREYPGAIERVAVNMDARAYYTVNGYIGTKKAASQLAANSVIRIDGSITYSNFDVVAYRFKDPYANENDSVWVSPANSYIEVDRLTPLRVRWLVQNNGAYSNSNAYFTVVWRRDDGLGWRNIDSNSPFYTSSIYPILVGDLGSQYYSLYSSLERPYTIYKITSNALYSYDVDTNTTTYISSLPNSDLSLGTKAIRLINNSILHISTELNSSQGGVPNLWYNVSYDEGNTWVSGFVFQTAESTSPEAAALFQNSTGVITYVYALANGNVYTISSTDGTGTVWDPSPTLVGSGYVSGTNQISAYYNETAGTYAICLYNPTLDVLHNYGGTWTSTPTDISNLTNVDRRSYISVVSDTGDIYSIVIGRSITGTRYASIQVQKYDPVAGVFVVVSAHDIEQSFTIENAPIIHLRENKASKYIEFLYVHYVAKADRNISVGRFYYNAETITVQVEGYSLPDNLSGSYFLRECIVVDSGYTFITINGASDVYVISRSSEAVMLSQDLPTTQQIGVGVFNTNTGQLTSSVSPGSLRLYIDQPSYLAGNEFEVEIPLYTTPHFESGYKYELSIIANHTPTYPYILTYEDYIRLTGAPHPELSGPFTITNYSADRYYYTLSANGGYIQINRTFLYRSTILFFMFSAVEVYVDGVLTTPLQGDYAYGWYVDIPKYTNTVRIVNTDTTFSADLYYLCWKEYRPAYSPSYIYNNQVNPTIYLNAYQSRLVGSSLMTADPKGSITIRNAALGLTCKSRVYVYPYTFSSRSTYIGNAFTSFVGTTGVPIFPNPINMTSASLFSSTGLVLGIHQFDYTFYRSDGTPTKKMVVPAVDTVGNNPSVTPVRVRIGVRNVSKYAKTIFKHWGIEYYDSVDQLRWRDLGDGPYIKPVVYRVPVENSYVLFTLPYPYVSYDSAPHCIFVDVADRIHIATEVYRETEGYYAPHTVLYSMSTDNGVTWKNTTLIDLESYLGNPLDSLYVLDISIKENTTSQKMAMFIRISAQYKNGTSYDGIVVLSSINNGYDWAFLPRMVGFGTNMYDNDYSIYNVSDFYQSDLLSDDTFLLTANITSQSDIINVYGALLPLYHTAVFLYKEEYGGWLHMNIEDTNYKYYVVAEEVPDGLKLTMISLADPNVDTNEVNVRVYERIWYKPYRNMFYSSDTLVYDTQLSRRGKLITLYVDKQTGRKQINAYLDPDQSIQSNRNETLTFAYNPSTATWTHRVTGATPLISAVSSAYTHHSKIGEYTSASLVGYANGIPIDYDTVRFSLDPYRVTSELAFYAGSDYGYAYLSLLDARVLCLSKIGPDRGRDSVDLFHPSPQQLTPPDDSDETYNEAASSMALFGAAGYDPNYNIAPASIEEIEFYVTVPSPTLGTVWRLRLNDCDYYEVYPTIYVGEQHALMEARSSVIANGTSTAPNLDAYGLTYVSARPVCTYVNKVYAYADSVSRYAGTCVRPGGSALNAYCSASFIPKRVVYGALPCLSYATAAVYSQSTVAPNLVTMLCVASATISPSTYIYTALGLIAAARTRATPSMIRPQTAAFHAYARLPLLHGTVAKLCTSAKVIRPSRPHAQLARPAPLRILRYTSSIRMRRTSPPDAVIRKEPQPVRVIGR